MFKRIRIAQKLWLAVIFIVVMLAGVVGFLPTGRPRCRPRLMLCPAKCRPA